MAEALPILSVNGMQTVMATAVPRPGRAPMMVPNRAPMTRAVRLSGVRVIWTAWMIASIMR